MKETIIRDPIHGFIDLSHYIFIKKIIDTPYFQRLRRLSQLGVSVFVYPSAVHNRFNHSLGAMQLFIKTYDHLFRDIRQSNFEKYEELKKIGIATVLLHDIGHGPFSHVSEKMLEFKHEALSKKIINEEMKDILEAEGISNEDVTSIIDGSIVNQKPHLKILSQLVSSTIDVDRLDYLARDIYFTGVGFGSIDLERIIRTMIVYNNPTSFLDGYMVTEEKGKRSIETLLLTRDVMYSDVYYHKTTRGIEGLLDLLFNRIKNLLEDNKIELPVGLQFMKDKQKVETADLFHLDDNYFYFHISKWATTNSDKIIQDICKRIINRRLFKVIEYPIGNGIIRIANAEEKIKKLILSKGFDPDYYYFMDEPQDRPYSPILSITNEEEQQKALEKNIFIKLHNSKCIEISQESKIIKTLTERDSFTRLYIPEGIREDATRILDQ